MANGREPDVHVVRPACVSITQITETGALYTPAEVAEIGAVCAEAGVSLHMDGARFANAVAALGCSPAELTWKAGVTALSFGTIKNGTMNADALVLFDETLAWEAAVRRKRAGHLASKMRFVAAQLEAYLEGDLWLGNARHANAMAARLEAGLAQLAGVAIVGPAAANILFCKFPQPLIAGLLAEGFAFYHDRWAPGVVRLVCSFATTADEVDAFVAAARLKKRPEGQPPPGPVGGASATPQPWSPRISPACRRTRRDRRRHSRPWSRRSYRRGFRGGRRRSPSR